MQQHFTLDDVFAAPTPKPLRCPNGRTMPVHECKLAGGSAALVQWSRWYGASIALHSRLSVIDKLRSLRRAAEVLEHHVQVDPENDFRQALEPVEGDLPVHRTAESALAPAELPAAKRNESLLGDRMVVCLDCGELFDPDSSPHEDRCWRDAELADEAGL